MGEEKFPKNGPLSGMILPALAGLFVLIGGASFSGMRGVFAAAPSEGTLRAFFISLCLMTLHKIESYFAGEYDACPVYLAGGQSSWGKNPRQAMFLSFVPTFLGLSFAAFLIMKGPPWPLLILLVWMAQGLHELHHGAKTLAAGKYYPGVVSSVLFVAQIDFDLFPSWYRQLDGVPEAGLYLYYAAQPLLFAAFWLEHAGWIKKLAEWRAAAANPGL